LAFTASIMMFKFVLVVSQVDCYLLIVFFFLCLAGEISLYVLSVR
jgi:hypothetical protein